MIVRPPLTGAWRTMVWRGAGGQVCIIMLRRRIDRALGGGAADEPIFGCFAVMINESDWTRAPVHAAASLGRAPTLTTISSPPCLLRLLPAGAVAGWGLHPLESAALSRRTPGADLRTVLFAGKITSWLISSCDFPTTPCTSDASNETDAQRAAVMADALGRAAKPETLAAE
jgi:hypothetical protein